MAEPKQRTTAKRRRRVAAGVYKDKYGLSAIVKVGARGAAQQAERRFPFDTPMRDVRAWQDARRQEMRLQQARPHAPTRGTLEADAVAYLSQVKHLASYKSRVCEVDAWTSLYGRLRRAHLTSKHVREARATWVADKYSAKTINNRCQTLRHLFRLLDGRRAPTPVDEVDPLTVTPIPKVNVPASVFVAVAKGLAGDPKTRARFMVLAATGVRPSELKRTSPGDLNLEHRHWTVRTGKGGEPRTLWLNDDMVAAWNAFAAADAWGPFDGSDYAKALYAAGWPKDVRPYQARHSLALQLSELGGDLGDVQGVLGHRQITTTRKHYAPILVSRLKGASEMLAGRFGWTSDSIDDLAAAEPTGGIQ